MTIGITVMVSQLYVELGEFSNALLVLRLEETAIGAGVAIATVLLVLPLHVGRVARVAARQQLEALGDLIDRCLARLADPASATGSDLELRASARRVDVAHQAMAATIQADADAAVRGARVARGRVRRDHGRRPALRAEPAARLVHPVPGAGRPGHLRAGRRWSSARRVDGDHHRGPDRTRDSSGGAGYVRSASLFARVADRLPDDSPLSRPQLALRDLELLDGALAEAARWAGVPVSEAEGARFGSHLLLRRWRCCRRPVGRPGSARWPGRSPAVPAPAP